MQNNIKRDYFWNTIGVFAQNAISPLLLIAITRINGIYDSGMFSFAFSISIIFWAIGMWGGRTFQVSDIKREFPNRSYIFVRFMTSIIIFIGSIIFSLANGYNITKSAIIITLVVFKIIESISDSIYGIMQSHDGLHIAGKSLLYKSIGGFILFITVDLFTKSVLLGSIMLLLANITIFFLYDLRIAKKLEDLTFYKSQINEFYKKSILIMKKCSPVFVISFLSMFSLNIPRYFIDRYHPEQIGYFGIIAMPITLIAIIMSLILQPNVVSLSKYYIDKKYAIFCKTIRKIATTTILIGLIILISTYAIGVPALKFAFGIEFGDYKLALIIMVAGGIVNSLVSIFINILIVMRSFKSQFYILLITNVALAIFSCIFIDKYGLIFGVILFFIVNILQFLLLYVLYKSYFGEIKK